MSKVDLTSFGGIKYAFPSKSLYNEERKSKL